MRLKMMFRCMAEGFVGLESKVAFLGEVMSYEYEMHEIGRFGRRLGRYG